MIDLARNSLILSKMADDPTLISMAAFDFSAPMNVAINYDDSDEDTKKMIALLSDEGQPKYSDEQRILEKKDFNLIDKRKIETNQQNNSSCQNVFPENKRSRIEVNDKNNDKIEMPLNQKSSTVQNVLNCINHAAHFSSTSTTCKSPNKKNKISKNDCSLNNIDVDVMKKEFQEVRNYIHTLLTTVSEHLILVINAFIDHSKIVNEHQNSLDGTLRIQDSKARYNRYKTHNFQLSYSAVVSVILEQENNTEFIEKFMDNTAKIAHSKYQLLYPVQYIKPFFYDLLFWAKQKRNYMNSNPTIDIQKSKEAANKNNTLLSKQLSQPAQVPPPLKLPKSSKVAKNIEENYILNRIPDTLPSLSRNAGYQEPQSIPIFSFGPPDREVRLSVQSNLLHIQNQQIAQITNNQHRGLPPPYHGQPENYFHRNQNNQHINYNIVNNLAPSSNGNMNLAPTATYNSKHLNIPYSVKDQSKQCYDQMKGANSRYQPSPFIGQPSQPLPPFKEFRAHNCPNGQQCNSHYQHQFVSLDRNQSSNLDDRYVQNVQNTSMSPKSVVECGRSVSTDSGFASPLQFSSGGDKTPAGPVEHGQFAPLITHVTSLNPNVVQIAEGSCHVCGKPTKTKCMGCYQVYYCNYQCANADWSGHMYICKRSTTS